MNYKVTVTMNKQLQIARHPVPRVQELYNKLHNSSYFCILDTQKVYLHLQLNKESSKIAALRTHRCTYLNKHLFFGFPVCFTRQWSWFRWSWENCHLFWRYCCIQQNTRTVPSKHVQVLHCLYESLTLNNWIIRNVNSSYRKFIIWVICIIHNGPEKDVSTVQAILKISEPKNADERSSFSRNLMHY